MIDRQHGYVIVVCDECADELNILTDSFVELMEYAKSIGWTSRKIANEWLHGCPKCGVPT